MNFDQTSKQLTSIVTSAVECFATKEQVYFIPGYSIAHLKQAENIYPSAVNLDRAARASNVEASVETVKTVCKEREIQTDNTIVSSFSKEIE